MTTDQSTTRNQFPLDLRRPDEEVSDTVWNVQRSNLQQVKTWYDFPPHALRVLEEEFAKGDNLITRKSVVNITAALGHRLGPWENFTSTWNSPVQDSAWARCKLCYHQVYFRGQSLDGSRGMVQLQPGTAFTLLCPMTHTVRSLSGEVEFPFWESEMIPTDELAGLQMMILGADQCGSGITLADLEHLQKANEDNDVVFWMNEKFEEKFVVLSQFAAQLLFRILGLDDKGGRKNRLK